MKITVVEDIFRNDAEQATVCMVWIQNYMSWGEILKENQAQICFCHKMKKKKNVLVWTQYLKKHF